MTSLHARLQRMEIFWPYSNFEPGHSHNSKHEVNFKLELSLAKVHCQPNHRDWISRSRFGLLRHWSIYNSSRLSLNNPCSSLTSSAVSTIIFIRFCYPKRSWVALRTAAFINSELSRIPEEGKKITILRKVRRNDRCRITATKGSTNQRKTRLRSFGERDSIIPDNEPLNKARF